MDKSYQADKSEPDPDKPASAITSITLQAPESEDGYEVSQLIDNCPPLDPNSRYCNLLQCSHFSETSVKAVGDSQEMVGFISGYLKPADPSVLFVWQIAVDARARGKKLAQRMLAHILNRPHNAGVTMIETTISPSNTASQRVFEKLAKQLGTEMTQDVLFDKERHFKGKHESEVLFRIGPFDRSAVEQLAQTHT